MATKDLSIEEMYARYISGYSTHCDYPLEEWFSYQEYFRRNKQTVEIVKKRIDAKIPDKKIS